MLASGHSHWQGNKGQLVSFMVEAPCCHMGTGPGNKGWKADYQQLVLTLVWKPRLHSKETVTLESTKHEMGARDLESWILLDLAGWGASCVSSLQSLHFSESYFLIRKGRAFSDDLWVFLGYTFGWLYKVRVFGAWLEKPLSMISSHGQQGPNLRHGTMWEVSLVMDERLMWCDKRSSQHLSTEKLIK